MKIELFAVCDHGTVDTTTGKMTLVGIFDTVYAESAPAIHRHLVLAVRTRHRRNEKGKSVLDVRFIDPDGRPFAPPLRATADIPENADGLTSPAQSVIELQELRFETFGEHVIQCWSSGKLVASTPLVVVRKQLHQG